MFAVDILFTLCHPGDVIIFLRVGFLGVSDTHFPHI
jgi:hypothetical protein